VTGTIQSLRSTESELNVNGWDLVKAGEDFFFTTEEPYSLDSVGAERAPPVMNVWHEAEATFEPLEVADDDPEPLLADEEYLYFHGDKGVYRMPLLGGEAGVVMPGGLNATQVNHSPTDTAHVFLSVATLYSIERPDGEATRFGCLPTNGYTYHALAAKGSTAYVSVFRRSDEKASIARVALP
jgi:hypothetical protein